MPKTIIIKMFIQRLDILRKNLNLIIFNFTLKCSLEVLAVLALELSMYLETLP